MPPSSVALFEQKEIRKIWHEDRWYFSVVDIVGILTDSNNPPVYWRVMKKRLSDEGSNETVSNCNGFKMKASDGKMRVTDCADTETILRIIQSIPSPKAEPFKRWLAKVGYERVQEIDDPELAVGRMRSMYEAKGYPKDWIAKRERGIAVRNTLTDEWNDRWIKRGIEYAILTDEIYRATFGMWAKEYKEFKGLDRENLRDHMGDLELIFTMLGEASTTAILQAEDSEGFDEAQLASRKGGEISGGARKNLEARIGKPIVSDGNFLPPERKKLKP